MKKLKDILIIILITVGMLLAIEGIIRLFWYTESKTEFLTHSAAVKMDSANYTYRYNPNMKYREINPEFTITYQTSSEGLRDNNTYLNREKDTSKIRIVGLGDSFTLGAGNEYDDTYLVKLENELKINNKKVEIVKAGVSSYNQFFEYYFLKDLVKLYRPEYVFVGFLPNDLFDNKPLNEVSQPKSLTTQNRDKGAIRSAANKWKFDYQTIEFGKRIILKNDGIYKKLYEGTYRIDFFKKYSDAGPDTKKQFEITAKLFRQIKSLCDSNGARLVVISIPQLYQVLKENENAIDVYGIDHYFDSVARENGFTWISTLEEFKKESRKGTVTHFRVDGHLTPVGNTILKNAILKSF